MPLSVQFVDVKATLSTGRTQKDTKLRRYTSYCQAKFCFVITRLRGRPLIYTLIKTRHALNDKFVQLVVTKYAWGQVVSICTVFLTRLNIWCFPVFSFKFVCSTRLSVWILIGGLSQAFNPSEAAFNNKMCPATKIVNVFNHLKNRGNCVAQKLFFPNCRCLFSVFSPP